VSADGKGTVFYTTKQDHILSLAMGASGMLYAGTDKGGLVYWIDPRGKGFVVHSAPQAEIRSLLVTADGGYAGTSSPTGRKRGGSGSGGASPRTTSLSSPNPGMPAAVNRPKGQRVAEEPSGGSAAASSASEPVRGHPAPAAPAPAVGENSLYRIGPDGTV